MKQHYNKKILKENITYLLKRKNLTKSKLAFLLNVSLITLLGWLNENNRGNINQDKVDEIAYLLHTMPYAITDKNPNYDKAEQEFLKTNHNNKEIDHYIKNLDSYEEKLYTTFLKQYLNKRLSQNQVDILIKIDIRTQEMMCWDGKDFKFNFSEENLKRFYKEYKKEIAKGNKQFLNRNLMIEILSKNKGNEKEN